MLCYNRDSYDHPFGLVCVGEWLSLVEHLVRDQGVGGSNPLSPTNLFQELTTILGFAERQWVYNKVYIGPGACGVGINSRQTVAAAILTASTRSSHHVL